jgi:hypothetical protein
MQQNRAFAVLSFVVILTAGAALAYARYRTGAVLEAGGIGVAAFIIASLLAAAIQVADQWDRAEYKDQSLPTRDYEIGLYGHYKSKGYWVG